MEDNMVVASSESHSIGHELHLLKELVLLLGDKLGEPPEESPPPPLGHLSLPL